MSEHITPLRTYMNVFLGLMLLTGLTTAVSFIDFGAFNDVIAMTIASVKALLVVGIFMHVKYSTPLIRLFAAAGFLWLAIFFVLILTDYNARIPVQGWIQ